MTVPPCICAAHCQYTTAAHQTARPVLLTMELEELTTSCSVQLRQIAIGVPFGEVGMQSSLYHTPHRRHTLCELIVWHLCLGPMVEGIPWLSHFDNVSHLWQGKVNGLIFSWFAPLNFVWQITILSPLFAYCHNLGVTEHFWHDALHHLRREGACDIDTEPLPSLTVSSLFFTDINFKVVHGLLILAARLRHSNTTGYIRGLHHRWQCCTQIGDIPLCGRFLPHCCTGEVLNSWVLLHNRG